MRFRSTAGHQMPFLQALSRISCLLFLAPLCLYFLHEKSDRFCPQPPFCLCLSALLMLCHRCFCWHWLQRQKAGGLEVCPQSVERHHVGNRSCWPALTSSWREHWMLQLTRPVSENNSQFQENGRAKEALQSEAMQNV